MPACIAAIAALVSLGTAHAATITETQSFGCGGDFAEGAFCNESLPAFDAGLGTLTGVHVEIAATERWYQETVINETSGMSSTMPIEAWLTVFGTENIVQINAAPRTWTVRHFVGPFSEAVSLRGGFVDDPALSLASGAGDHDGFAVRCRRYRRMCGILLVRCGG